jgi:hypothetical protein
LTLENRHADMSDHRVEHVGGLVQWCWCGVAELASTSGDDQANVEQRHDQVVERERVARPG